MRLVITPDLIQMVSLENLYPESYITKSYFPDIRAPKMFNPENCVPNTLHPESVFPENLQPGNLFPEKVYPECQILEHLNPGEMRNSIESSKHEAEAGRKLETAVKS